MLPDRLLEQFQRCESKSMPYNQWLQQWQSNLIPIPLFYKILSQAALPIPHFTKLRGCIIYSATHTRT